jgi:predicted transcriptional regulator
MPRNRAGAQLAIQAPPELLERLRAAAAAQRRTVTALVLEAIEAALSGGLPAAATPAACAELLQRVAALEAAVAQLQRPALPERVSSAPRTGDALAAGQLEIIGTRQLRGPEPEAASPERVEPIPLWGDAITTAELAEQTGTNRAAWNNWAAKAAPGDVRHHPEAGSWRLLGKAPAPGGGPERWLWEQVET